MASYTGIAQPALEDSQAGPKSDPAYAQLGIDPNASASDTYAAILRQQWQSYMQNFVPLENQLIQYATDKSLPGQSMATARQDVDSSYTAQAGSFQRGMQGLGVQLTPEQSQAHDRETGLSQALARVQGANTARDLTVASQQSVLGNPAPTTESIAAQATQLGS